MRLTNNLREAFVRSVLLDVPKLDDKFQNLRQMAADFVISECTPKEVQKLMKNPETKDYIQYRPLEVALYSESGQRLCTIANTYYGDFPTKSGVTVTVPNSGKYGYGNSGTKLRWADYKDKPKFIKLYQEAEKMLELQKARDLLEQQLKSAAASCSTLKQLQEVLPAYKKYMPSEPDQPIQKKYALAVNQKTITDAFKLLGAPLDKTMAATA